MFAEADEFVLTSNLMSRFRIMNTFL